MSLLVKIDEVPNCLGRAYQYSHDNQKIPIQVTAQEEQGNFQYLSQTEV